jgi:CubicO group peptidase (beta-lactamase class C family)
MIYLPNGQIFGSPDIEKLDVRIDEMRVQHNVPGAAFLLVSGDTDLINKGYGVKSLLTGEPVDPDTEFQIASITKSFTAASLGLQMEDPNNELSWKTVVHEVLPEFEMNDRFIRTRDVLVSDLVTHRTGIARHDIIWYGLRYSREEIMHRIRYMERMWGFREEFHYNNLFWSVAGHVAEKKSGMAWDALIKEQFCKPLGMSRTSFSVNDLDGMVNVATPHDRVGKEVRPIEYHSIDEVGPAGSGISNIRDLRAWLQLHMNNGKYAGKQLISEATMKEMHKIQQEIRIRNEERKGMPPLLSMGYGFGWFIEFYRGLKVIHHGGNMDGMTALVFFVPELNIGAALLTNLEGTPFREAVMYTVIDSFLGPQADGKQVDWSSTFIQQEEENQAAEKKHLDEKLSHRKANTTPSVPLSEYVGTYTHKVWGDVSVSLAADQSLWVKMRGEMIAKLEHYHFDVFAAQWRRHDAGTMLLNFVKNVDGKVMNIDEESYFGNFNRISDQPASLPLIPPISHSPIPAKPPRYQRKFSFYHLRNVPT